LNACSNSKAVGQAALPLARRVRRLPANDGRATSSSGSVRCIKHNYPDHRDKSEGHKRGQRHELLPIGDYAVPSPNISVTLITAPSQDQCFALTAPPFPTVHIVPNLGPLNGRPAFFVSGTFRGWRREEVTGSITQAHPPTSALAVKWKGGAPNTALITPQRSLRTNVRIKRRNASTDCWRENYESSH